MYIIDSLFSFLTLCGEQNKSLSTNIANVNTPNFKATMVTAAKKFESYRANLDCTHNQHIALSNTADKLQHVLMQEEEKPNGNTVHLLTQMSELSKNNTKHEAVLSLFKGIFDCAHLASHGKI